MRHKVLISLAASLLVSTCTLRAQVQTGTYANGTFDSKGFDAINVGNLNVYFSVPVFSKSGRGLPLYYNLAYNSSIWSPSSVGGGGTWTPNFNWGWTAQTDAETGYFVGNFYSSTCLFGGHKVAYEVHTWYAWVDTFGVLHPFSELSDNYQSVQTSTLPACTGIDETATGTATDGSGLTISAGVASATVTARNGTVVSAPIQSTTGTGSNEDSNGNYISINSSGQVIDTTGNPVLTMSGSAPNPITYTYNDTSGSSHSVTVNYSSYTVQTNFDCSGVSEFGPTSEYLISSISYPDGSSYSFTYEPTPGVSGNVTGRLASVTLPQGGTISYSYSGGNNGIECLDGSATGLTRMLNSDSGSSASIWTYTRSNVVSGTSNTTVVDGLNNTTNYSFILPSNLQNVTAQYYETQRSVYQGSATGTPILARNTCYNGASSPCTTAAPTLPLTQIDTYETLSGIETHGATVKLNDYGMDTEADTYDFAGSGSRGSLLRKEVWTYGYSIPNLPTEDDVYDGNGMLAGKTLYTYDGTTPTTSSGVPQHATVSGVRGNLTSETVYANATTSYTTNTNYEDTGSPLTISAPNGTTTLYYDSTFVYNNSVSLPTPSSGVALGESEGFDTTYTGLPLNVTDPNSQITSVPSYDSMLRPTEVDYPDGGKTTYAYGSPIFNQTGIHSYQNSSTYSDTEFLKDGYGRQSRSAFFNGQNPNIDWYQVDNCYDANDNLFFQTYSYQASGFATAKNCSSGGDTYSYDPLGRVLQVAHADGTSIQYTYLGRATQTVDENGVTRISQVDGLGRTAVVCEISSNGNMPGSGSPQSCGTDISGTGFTTNYSYSLATPTTTITQGGQTRIFQTDWLGRPTSATEPESGTTTYSYAYNSTGLQVIRTRPQANQTNPSVTATSTYQYDSLGRVTAISYSDGTGTRNFSYDVPIGWPLTQNYLKGRLSGAYMTTPGIQNGVATVFSYDQMGRVLALGECFPSLCGNGAEYLNYTYDWEGNLLTSTDGNLVTSTYSYTPANEVLSLTSSQNNSTNPPNIMSSVQNGPDGPFNWSLGNELSGVHTYNALGRQNGGWICSGSTSAECSGGQQIYGYAMWLVGSQVRAGCDTVLNTCANAGYDEFNRLISWTGSAQAFSYVYDRWGNRTQQSETAGSGGPQPSFSFNTTNNQITNPGYHYDAAGNMINDGAHSYTYDAENNIIAVDGGATAQYTYDALNRRVQTDVPGASTPLTEFVYNVNGQRVSEWDGSNNTEMKGHYYWGTQPIAFYTGGQTYFEHQDWTGTERVRTAYDGSVADTFTSLPFGDAQNTAGGSDPDQYFAALDYDSETATDHAQFRQYANSQGRWMSPDPYSGSYDFSNPQSFNRYAYVLNSPLSFTDPSGLDDNCLENGGGGDGSDDSSTQTSPCNGSGGGSGGEGGGSGEGGGDNPQCYDINGNAVPCPPQSDPDDPEPPNACAGYPGGVCPTSDPSGPTGPGGGGGGGATNNGRPCLAGAGPLAVGQSRCPPGFPKGSNLTNANCNNAIPAISGTYNVPGAPGGTAATSYNNLPLGGQCVGVGPSYTCYSVLVGNCGLTYCAAYYVPFQQLAPGIYIPKNGANLVQQSTQCTTINPNP